MKMLRGRKLSEPRKNNSPCGKPNWLELPDDITTDILHRLGAVEILENAQKVCTTWYKICKDPFMWRVIDLHDSGKFAANPFDVRKMFKHAISRSQGQLADIKIGYFGSAELMNYGAHRSNSVDIIVYYGGGFVLKGLYDVSYADGNVKVYENVSTYTLTVDAIKSYGRTLGYGEDMRMFVLGDGFNFNSGAIEIAYDYHVEDLVELFGHIGIIPCYCTGVTKIEKNDDGDVAPNVNVTTEVNETADMGEGGKRILNEVGEGPSNTVGERILNEAAEPSEHLNRGKDSETEADAENGDEEMTYYHHLMLNQDLEE